MKKFLLSLALVAFAASASMAQTANVSQPQVKKECCKDHKDGQKCDKPADQQCPDCKEKAAKQCDKAAMKHECKEGMKDCKKAEGMKHECKEGAAKQCDKAAMKKMHQECKDHKDGQKCDKPADQQCPDCKEKAKKN
jgi:hypothetical protein